MMTRTVSSFTGLKIASGAVKGSRIIQQLHSNCVKICWLCLRTILFDEKPFEIVSYC